MARMTDKRRGELLTMMHESIMSAVNMYFVDSVQSWLSGQRGRSQAGCLASNPRTQLVQSQWKSWRTGRMQRLPEGHTWGTSGSIARYESIFVSPELLGMALEMAMDVLFTRCMPPVIIYVAARALATLPKTMLRMEAKRRLGSASTAFCAWLDATSTLADAILEESQDKKRTRKKSVKISWSEVSTPRSKKASDDVADEARVMSLLRTFFSDYKDADAKVVRSAAQALLKQHSRSELEAMEKVALLDLLPASSRASAPSAEVIERQKS